ncbi:c2h2-type zinc finger-containing protein [Nannochloropsis gaditana]|uniref:C2h2-type zinc finger-containing protein n=1 Tax=Nannochloropsis gaditana TaxID=72520 RepID=W7TIC1_9STRA|nr:c2h2-type zinc finger-containing protein [Nannochloropsis gaditana]
MELLKCQTCGLGFNSSSAHKDHYRSELHRYNSKRRTNELGPVSEHDYQRRKAAAQSLIGSEGSASHGFHGKCQVCNRTFASKATLQQHLKSRKHAYATERSTQTTSKSEIVSEGGVVMAALGGSERKDRSGTTEEDDTVGPADLDPEVCIFCNRRYFTVESAILHMWKQHGFHLPDGEFLVDLHGLLRYCAEKVKIGCMCLYCNGKGKSFLSPRDAQHHMEAKSHCKLLYEEGEDLHEFRPFYDFSASYQVLDSRRRYQEEEKMTNKTGPKSSGIDLGAVDDDDMSLETVDSAYEELSDGGGMTTMDDGGNVGKGGEMEQIFDHAAMRVSHLGELVLPDGRSLGCRENNRYYKQYYRPEDTRVALIASKQEKAGRMASGSHDSAMVRTGNNTNVAYRSGVSREGMLENDRAARRAVMKVTAAVRRTCEKYRLRREISTNKFHKRPQIDG